MKIFRQLIAAAGFSAFYTVLATVCVVILLSLVGWVWALVGGELPRGFGEFLCLGCGAIVLVPLLFIVAVVLGFAVALLVFCSIHVVGSPKAGVLCGITLAMLFALASYCYAKRNPIWFFDAKRNPILDWLVILLPGECCILLATWGVGYASHDPSLMVTRVGWTDVLQAAWLIAWILTGAIGSYCVTASKSIHPISPVDAFEIIIPGAMGGLWIGAATLKGFFDWRKTRTGSDSQES